MQGVPFDNELVPNKSLDKILTLESQSHHHFQVSYACEEPFTPSPKNKKLSDDFEKAY